MKVYSKTRFIVLLLLYAAGLTIRGQPTCTTDYTNKYDLTSPPLPAASVTVSNAAACTFPVTVDTKLYLGDPYSGAHRPAKNRDFGLEFDGYKIAVIKASTYHSISSNWI